jgi:hypothetical protein
VIAHATGHNEAAVDLIGKAIAREKDARCQSSNYSPDERSGTASIAQVRQPIYKSSVGRWRPYHEHLRPLLKELGIDADDAVPHAVAESVAG